ncbi:hypothetical protein RJ639_001315 [Escallonia herrerae]|uniref:Pentatricopeptide repeat-containing protein n=1 Tax=Escallonia herrerae TaxID=1293975 RepID=A0AA89BH58_9ASTE|nr:hypothetical protein RJ639_001315 [Escallonia herrerae]
MSTTNLCLSPLVTSTASTTTVNGGAPTPQHQHSTTTTHLPKTGSLKSCKNVQELKQLHAQLTKNRPTQSPQTLTNLIVSACAEIATPESLEYARKAFNLNNYDETVSNTLYMLNCLIRGYSHAGLVDEAIRILLEMVTEGVAPDNFTFPFVLSACAKGVAYVEGIQIHGFIVKMGLGEDVFIENSLIHFYCECGEVGKGRKVFDEMPERNIVSWTSLICGYGRRDLPKEAVGLFFEMVEAGIRPNPVTMVCVISACAKLQNLELAERVCGYIGESGLKVNTVLANALVDMYMKCGANDSAKRLFDECVDRNLVLYNTILSNYARQGLAREAFSIMNEMLRQGPPPDRVTLLSAISASAELGDLLLGKQCHGYVLRNGFEGWDSISNVLIDMYMNLLLPFADIVIRCG